MRNVAQKADEVSAADTERDGQPDVALTTSPTRVGRPGNRPAHPKVANPETAAHGTDCAREALVCSRGFDDDITASLPPHELRGPD